MRDSNTNVFRMDLAQLGVDSATFAITKVELDVVASLVYEQALRLVKYIDMSLKLGTHHFRLKCGRLLRTLDEVVSAILRDDLVW